MVEEGVSSSIGYEELMDVRGSTVAIVEAHVASDTRPGKSEIEQTDSIIRFVKEKTFLERFYKWLTKTTRSKSQSRPLDR